MNITKALLSYGQKRKHCYWQSKGLLAHVTIWSITGLNLYMLGKLLPVFTSWYN